MSGITIPRLQEMRVAGEKIVGVVAWDAQAARIVDRAEVDIVSVGDSVGVNLWGRTNPLDVTLDEMVTVARAVRTGVKRALVSCDFPFGPLQQGGGTALQAAIRLVQDAGVDIVKLDGAATHLRSVEEIANAGIPVFAQFGITPQTAMRHGIEYSQMASPATTVPSEMTDHLIADARALEAAGASLLDFQNSGPIAGPAVVASVGIPVLGGFGGGPWLDGRMRMINGAIGYEADMLDDARDTYANVASVVFDAVASYADDVRASRQIRGAVDPLSAGGSE